MKTQMIEEIKKQIKEVTQALDGFIVDEYKDEHYGNE